MNNFIFREIKEGEFFDPLTICPNTPFTQAQFYGDWQKNSGREVKRFIVLNDKKIIAYFQLIKYPLLLGKNYFYIPYGPIIKNYSKQFLESLKIELKNIAKKNNAIFIRLDFTPPPQQNEEKKLLEKNFIKAPPYTYHSAQFQPRIEWFLNLEKSENELLMAMHEKTRYSIRLAEKKGLTAEIITEDFKKYFEIFYELMSITAKRNNFNLHNKIYYKKIFQNLSSSNAFLVVTKYKEKILVIKLIIRYGKIANNIFSGSSNEYRNLRPTYLTQWKEICYAKKLGDNFCNFGGISSKKIYKNWNGLTVFKKRFGGVEIIHSDFFDVVTQPFWYHLYKFRKFIKNYIKKLPINKKK